MAATTEEPRALSAALAAPTFVTRGGGVAMHAATRHVERWAPEAGASRVRPLRNLGFVDRLVSPWMQTAQRSSSLRMFSQYLVGGLGERMGARVSWVFPRPWYQDELDWMAAAREIGEQSAMDQAAPTLLTTRGTFVPPAAPARTAAALSPALYELVAPSLSLARPDGAVVAASADAYSPLVPFAAAKAAQVMARMVAPLAPGGGETAPRTSPALRAMLAAVLERTMLAAGGAAPTRLAAMAPTLVTPPAPRAAAAPAAEGAESPSAEREVMREAGEQRAQIAELQRVARAIAEREVAARMAAAQAATARPAASEAASARPTERTSEDRARVEARIAERLAERERESRAQAAQTEVEQRARVEQIESAREAARGQAAQRLHEQAREAAARDARAAAVAPAGLPLERAELARTEPTVGETRAAELAAAIASLPPELAAAITASVGQQPERAVQAIRELDDALRAVDLLARASVGGGSFESARGPRVVMPAGLGGLVASLETHASMPAAATTRAAAGAPALRWLEPRAYGALASTASSTPAAVQHVAWADRWLARFAGASPRALETLDLMSAGPSRLAELASAAPSAVFVAPAAERAATAGELASAQVVAAPVEALRLDDNAETPDDLLAQISAAASRQRRRPAVAAQPLPPSDEPQRPVAPRETLADVVARSAPMAPGAGFSAQLASSPFARSLGHVLPLASAPMFDVRALLGAGLAASYLAGFVGEASHELPRSEMPSLAPPAWAATYIVPDMRDSAAAERDREPGVAEAEAKTPLVARRSPLLSLDPVAAAPFARTLVDALGAPMLDETAAMAPSAPVAGTASAPEYAVASAAPGMIGDRAHAWSVAQERSTADLTFDFVTPELVLAARVYGLGPAEAAQAMRLALVGPSQLAAMASAVDRTFVQVMQVEASRRQSALRDGESPLSAVTTAYPIASGAPAAAAPAAVSPTAMFGVERRAPRGAFLWPSAAVGALGLHAPAPDGELQMPVAALELIAAHGVAELGAVREMAMAGEAAAAAAATPATPATFAAPAGQPEADVVAAAAALVPAERRAKFEALYVALARSATDRTSSPAARAARAVALAGRGEDTISARERAAVAWDVLPAIYATPSFETEAQAEASLSTGARAVRAEQRRAELREAFALESRPGLGGLTSRAGEALGVFVSPTGAPIAPTLSSSSSTSSASREVGTLLRAPTAAPELVQTGSARPTARHGGGEVEIPAWFESAARRMFTERSSAESATLAELTLVMSAPATQVAASSRAAPSAVPPAASPGTNASTQGGQQIDIEKTANEVYQQVLVLIEAARARNGVPYL